MLARNPLLAALATLALALAACGDARQVQEGSGGGACTSCHGTAGLTGNLGGTDPNLAAAPPRAPTGEPTQVVGAHQAHLNPPATGSLRGPIACAECHQVPQDANHATNPPAQIVQFGTLATTGGAAPTWNGVNTPTGINTPTCSNVYCHGNFTFNGVSGNGGNQPDWTVSGQPACTTCHAMPPAGHFPLGGTVTAATCNGCHSATVDSSGRIIVAADGSSHHVNGQPDVDSLSCSGCHGTPGRVGNLPGTDTNLAAAPPAAPPASPTAVVGAHQAHLNPASTGSFSGPIACSECHVVPTDLAHADNPPAQVVVFGALATAPVVPADGTNPGTPTWNSTDKVTNTTCSNVYCHGSFSWNGNGQGGQNVIGNLANAPDWTLTNQAACGSCHALPPTNHIQSGFIVAGNAATCNGCHPGTVDAGGNILVDVATGQSLHVNGQIDEGAHTDPNWLTATGGDHTAAALNQSPPFQTCLACHAGFGAADPNNDAGSSCNTCHAAALAGAATTNWQQNCVFCHGSKAALLTYTVADQTSDPWIIAPPTGARGETATTSLAVGAHQQHASATGNVLSTAFACSECHTPTLPPDISQTDHLSADGSVPVLLAGALATHGGVQGTFTAPSCAATYCHGNYTFTFGTGTPAVSGNNATPVWNQVDGTFAACTSCHGAPPNTGRHAFHITTVGLDCSACHNGVATGSGASVPVTNGAIVGPSFHVNGSVNVILANGRTWDGTNWSPTCTFLGPGIGCHQ